MKFFRSGQVFSLRISTEFQVNHSSHRRVRLSQLPLDPIAALKAEQEQIQRKDREKRLAQIFSLPLAQMIPYAKEQSDGKVLCTLCDGEQAIYPRPKDHWADWHFRFCHWKEYCAMRNFCSGLASVCLMGLCSCLKSEQSSMQLRASSQILPKSWISLKDITSDFPIRTDRDIRDMFDTSQGHEPHIAGPILIRRFVVIQEGLESCLCLGIHT